MLFFFCVFFFFFYFIKISKFALPGVMLMYERTSKDRKKERKDVMSGEVEKCPILHVRPKFDVFTLVGG